MSGLLLISEYESNSEGSGSDGDDSTNTVITRVQLPAPNLSKVVVVPQEAHIDNSELHGGRTRSFPHARGNWASLIYIKYDTNVFYELVNKLKQAANNNIEDCQECEDLHISLSKTFILKYHLLSPFHLSLQEALSSVKSFHIRFSNIKIYCNEECSRTFIALELDTNTQKLLLDITKQVDEVLSEYQLPTFYEEPSFHMSILWVVGNKQKELTTLLEDLNEILYRELSELPESVPIKSINCRAGNKYFQYSLC